MKRRRKTDRISDTVIVKTDDGKTFRCSIVSKESGTHPHWALMDENAQQFLGPPVLHDHSPGAIQRQIAEWWAGRNRAPKSGPEPRPADRESRP